MWEPLLSNSEVYTVTQLGQNPAEEIKLEAGPEFT